MATVFDVSAYILEKCTPMTAMKLQKLCYYAKAWHLVWESAPLFPEKIEAWANGPVCPQLYASHRGCFEVNREPGGDPSRLTASEKESIDVVLDHYGPMNAYQLSALTHTESPWKDARRNLAPGAWSNAEITEAAMDEYYGSLIAAE